MSTIIGHQRILDFFTKVQEADRLSHAYCFVGRESLGKRAVAEQIASALIGVDREKMSSHPDVQIVTQEKDEKTGKTKKNISVAQLKHVQTFLSQRPFLATRKIVIIDNAEKMNLSAANALLKTLEEPRPYAMLFLVTSDETLLPQTIQSRCQSIFFQSVATSEIQEHLEGVGIDPQRAAKLAVMSLGLPGRAVAWAEDESVYDAYVQEVARFESLLGEPLYKKMKQVDDLFGDKTDHIATREALVRVLQLWEVLVGDHSYRSHAVAASAVDASIKREQVSVIYKRIHEAMGLLQKNIHPKLLVEHVLLSLP